MNNIHPSAIVSEKATIGTNVKIGPFCIIGDNVTLKDGVELKSHVVIEGRTFIDENTTIFPFASIGCQPQGRMNEYSDECELFIGKNNIIREYVTMQPGTKSGGKITRVGSNGQFMAGIHIAHDCQIGDNVIMANYATLAGHVHVDNNAYIGGLAAVHQFVRIGKHAFIGGKAGVKHDIIPYAIVIGNTEKLSGLNLVGLKRSGIPRSEILEMTAAYDELFADQLTLKERVEDVSKKYADQPRIMDIIEFINSDTRRAITLPAA